MKRYIILAFPLLAAGLCAQAQDLNKEITIDRDIIPTERAAARPVVFPSLLPPVVSPVTLTMQPDLHPSAISPALTYYAPASTGGAFPATPFRGYVDLGYFPTLDAGLSAGYAILDRKDTKLNVAVQLDTRDYKGLSGTSTADFRFKTFDVGGKVDFMQRFGSFNTLRVGTDGAYSRTTLPDYTAGNVRWHLNAAFDGRAGSVTYGVSAGGGIFNHTNSDALHQTSMDFGAYLRGNVTANALLGVRVEGKFLHFNHYYTSDSLLLRTVFAGDKNTKPFDIQPGGKTVGQVDVIPAAEYNSGAFYGRAGVRLGFSVNGDKSFHAAPDVMLALNPASAFGAWVQLGGGVQTNSLEDMWQLSRYADPRLATSLSNVAFTGQLGVRVGPFYGASLTLTCDYAAANHWLMPTVLSADNTTYNVWTPSRIRAWKAEARFEWQFRKLLNVALSYDANLGGGQERHWLYWRDGARQVIGASLAVTPIRPLEINAGFTVRLDRGERSINGTEIIYTEWRGDEHGQDYILGATAGCRHTSLGDLSNLYAGASYRITEAFTAFARFDNILNKRTQLMFGVPSQGFTGLFGVGYKF